LHARLVEEPGLEAGVGAVLLADGLDDHRALGALEPERRREHDLAHPALGDTPEQDVPAEPAREIAGAEPCRPWG